MYGSSDNLRLYPQAKLDAKWLKIDLQVYCVSNFITSIQSFIIE